MSKDVKKPGAGGTRRTLSFKKLQQASILILLAVLCAFASFRSPTFFSWTNLVDNLLTNAAALGIIAIGMTFVMIAGGFDLSVASNTAVCSVVLVLTMDSLSSCGAVVAISAALLLTALVGISLGAINGVLIARVGVNPFVVTLSTMLVFRGIALILTRGGQAKQVADIALRNQFSWIYDAQIPIFGQNYQISMPIVLFLLVFGIGTYLLRFTRFGHYIFAIGGNEEAVRLSGVPVARYKTIVYSICGLMSSLAGIVLTARLTAAEPIAGTGYELDAIAAAVIGGTSLSGGIATIFGTVIGALIMSVLRNGLNLLNIQSYYQLVAIGSVIVIAVTIDTMRRKK